MENIANQQKSVVLVVDDDALVRLNAVLILEEHGFEIIEADNAETAFQILETHPEIGLIFTDVQMPGAFDGIELAIRVKKRWPNIQLVVTSGRILPGKFELPQESRFISKPYPARELLAQIRDLLGAA